MGLNFVRNTCEQHISRVNCKNNCENYVPVRNGRKTTY